MKYNQETWTLTKLKQKVTLIFYVCIYLVASILFLSMPRESTHITSIAT